MPNLIPTIVQDTLTQEVLMLGYSNEEAIQLTKATGYVHFYSRSRNQLWKKGQTSGNLLALVSSGVDCDGDALLYRVHPRGPTCHTGRISCFDTAQPDVLLALEKKMKSRLLEPISEKSYTHRLITGTQGYLVRKLIEEAGEVAEALVEGQDNLGAEAADLLYHLMAVLMYRGLSLKEVYRTLESRG